MDVYNIKYAFSGIFSHIIVKMFKIDNVFFIRLVVIWDKTYIKY